MQKYEVLGLVGEGAYGVVLKCRRKDTGELVAVKTFKGNEESTSVRKTIAREVNALKNLRHENIVWLKEAFRRKGKLHLVFEYIQKNLLEVLQASPNGLDRDTVRLYIWQLVKALNYCHNNDIIHRDIKPENLLVNPKTRKLQLCDFGFARHVQEASGILTDYVATRWYRSPELLLCDPDYGKPVDMWAVGCIMGELIDGQPLFPGDNEIDQLYKIQLVLGALPPQHMERFKRSSRFAGLSFPKLPPRQTLPLRYLGKFDKVAIDFLTKLLCMDPHHRLTAKMALQHPYFRRLQSPAEDPRPLVPLASSNQQPPCLTQEEWAVHTLKGSFSSLSKMGIEEGEHQDNPKNQQDVLAARCPTEGELSRDVPTGREKAEITPSAAMPHQQHTAATSPAPPKRRQVADELPSQCPVKRSPVGDSPPAREQMEQAERLPQQHGSSPSHRLVMHQVATPCQEQWQEDADQSPSELPSDSIGHLGLSQGHVQLQTSLTGQDPELPTKAHLAFDSRQNPTPQPLSYDEVERRRRRQEGSQDSELCAPWQLRQRPAAVPTTKEKQRMRRDSPRQQPSEHYELRAQNTDPHSRPPVSEHGVSHSSTQVGAVQQRSSEHLLPPSQCRRENQCKLTEETGQTLKGGPLTEGPLRRQKVQRREGHQQLLQDSIHAGAQQQQQSGPEEGTVPQVQTSDTSFSHEQQKSDGPRHFASQCVPPKRHLRAGRAVEQHQEMLELTQQAGQQQHNNPLCIGGSGLDLQSPDPASSHDRKLVHRASSNKSSSGRGREFPEVQPAAETQERMHGAGSPPQVRPPPAKCKNLKKYSAGEKHSELAVLHPGLRHSAVKDHRGIRESEEADPPVQQPLSSHSPFEACSVTGRLDSSAKYFRQRKAVLPSQTDRSASETSQPQQRGGGSQSSSCIPSFTEGLSCLPQAPRNPTSPSNDMTLSPTPAPSLPAPVMPRSCLEGGRSDAPPQGDHSYAYEERRNEVEQLKCRGAPSRLSDQGHLSVQTDTALNGASCAAEQSDSLTTDRTQSGRRAHACEQPYDHGALVGSFPNASPERRERIGESWASVPMAPLQWQSESQLLARDQQQNRLEDACEAIPAALKNSIDSDRMVCPQRLAQPCGEALPNEARKRLGERESSAAAEVALTAHGSLVPQEQMFFPMASPAGGKGTCTSTLPVSDQWTQGERRRSRPGEQPHQQRPRRDAPAEAQLSLCSEEAPAGRKADVPRLVAYPRNRARNGLPHTTMTPTHMKKSKEQKSSFGCSSRGSSWDGTGTGRVAADRRRRRGGGGGMCRQRKAMDEGSGTVPTFGVGISYFSQEDQRSGPLKVYTIPEADPDQPSRTKKTSQPHVGAASAPMKGESEHVLEETSEFTSPTSTSQKVLPPVTREPCRPSPAPLPLSPDFPPITAIPCSCSSPANANRRGPLGVFPSKSHRTDAAAVALPIRTTPPAGAFRISRDSKQRRPSFGASTLPQSPLHRGTVGPLEAPRVGGAVGGGAGPGGSLAASATGWRKTGIHAGRYRVGLGNVLPLYGALAAPVATLVAAKSVVPTGMSRKSSQNISSVPNGARYLLPVAVWTKGAEEAHPPPAPPQPAAVGDEPLAHDCSHSVMWAKMQNVATFTSSHQQRVLDAVPPQVPVSTLALGHHSQLCSSSHSSSSTSSPRPAAVTRSSVRASKCVNPAAAAGGAPQQRVIPPLARGRYAAVPGAGKGMDLQSVHVSIDTAAGTRYERRLNLAPKATVQGNNAALKHLQSSRTYQQQRPRQHQRAGDASGSVSTSAVAPAVEAVHVTRETSGALQAQRPALSSSAPASSVATILPAAALADVCSVYKDILSKSARGPPPAPKGRRAAQ